MNQVEKPPVAKRPRERSPGYPAINLERAITRAREIWDKDKQYATPVDAVVKHWGYKSINGPASLALSALKKFGLVTVEQTKGDRRVKVSDLAVEILNHPDMAVRRTAIQKAALTPGLHKELWAKYGANLPSNPVLKWNLTHDMNFTEFGADEFIPQYQQTIAFANLVEGDGLESAGDSQNEDSEEDDEEPDSGDNRMLGGAGRSRRERRPREGSRVIDIPLPGGSSVIVEGQFPLSESEWTQFLAVLTVMKPGLVAAVENADSPEF